MTGSTSWHLNKEDLGKILRGAGVAIVGVLLTYFSEIIGHTDFTVLVSGQAVNLAPFVAAIWAVIFNVLRKWVTDNTVSETK